LKQAIQAGILPSSGIWRCIFW